MFATRIPRLLFAEALCVVILPVTLNADEPFIPFPDDALQPPYIETLMLTEEKDSADAKPADAKPDDPLDARFKSLEDELKKLKASLEKKPEPKKEEKPVIVYPTVKVTGFFQADAGWFHQDAASIAHFATVPPTAPSGDIQDDRGFRRARLAAVGSVNENTKYMLEMDFAFNGRPSFMDVWMEVANLTSLGNVRIGQFRQPFGLDELTSVKELTFLERPLMFGMGPFRQIGVQVADISKDENSTYAMSIFGGGTDPWGDSIGDRGYGGAARVTKVLMEDCCGDFLVHGGLGYVHQQTPNSFIQYRNVPEYGGPFLPTAIAPGSLIAAGSVPFFVDTGPMAAENANLVNAELAGTWGSVHAQSELRYAMVNTKAGGTIAFPSFYAQAGWILTGEHRPYNKQSAALGRIKPKSVAGAKCGGSGAWELAVRYSWMDFNQGGIAGGELTNMTYGINWYLNDYTKLQFNYIDADLDTPAVGPANTDIFAMRAQLDF
ncbi:MAG: porin [Planctomycetaceae bacterium]|nr:porin [Planctomycetaceae bacterium]